MVKVFMVIVFVLLWLICDLFESMRPSSAILAQQIGNQDAQDSGKPQHGISFLT